MSAPRSHRCRAALALGLVGASTPAIAGFEATGAAVPPASADPLDPLLSWRGRRAAQGAASFSMLFEAASAPLVRTSVDPLTGGPGEREIVLTDLGGFSLGGRYAVSDRVEIAATLPVWLGARAAGETGGGLGDLGLHVPIGLGGADVGGVALAASVVPSVTLPTGAARRYLGDAGPSVTTLAVGEALAGPVIAAAWLGLGVRSFRAEDNARPGPAATGGASVGVGVGEHLGVHLGWRMRAQLLPAELEFPVPDAPRRVAASELSLAARARLTDDVWAGLGVASATQQGPGAADLRLWLGGGVTFGGAAADPLALPSSLRVVDPAGAPVPGAVVRNDGVQVGLTDAAGEIAIQPQRWRRGDRLTVIADGYVAAQVEPPDEGATATVQLGYRPVTISARVRDEQGRPLASQFAVDGDEVADQGRLGELSIELLPGEYTLSAASQGFGPQERTLALDVAGASSEQVDFILLPQAGDRGLDVRLIDVDGQPVQGATLSLAGRPVGRSASGGSLRIGGLGPEPVVLDAQADTYRDITRPEVDPGIPDTQVELMLVRERGAVQVVVRGPSGERVGDASARFVGADRLGPFPLGELGRRTFVLRPGPWQLLVASPRYGLQQRALDLSDREAALQVVEVVLQPPEEGRVDLTVRVVDPDNQAISGAEVRLDGVLYGTTSSGGELGLLGLREGPRRIEVGGERFVDTVEETFLMAGLQERLMVVGWQPGTTLVLARSPGGMAGDATARFAGPSPPAPARLGADGFGFFKLEPGLWQVLVASPSLGAQQHGLAIPQDSRSLHVVDALLDPGLAGVGELTVEVFDPAGAPVRGASVLVDGVERGVTGSTGALGLRGLDLGQRTVQVRGPLFSDGSATIDVSRDPQTARIALDWGVGALRVAVRADGRPVPDATVRLGGARFIPASPVDASGERLFALDPGIWQVLVASPEKGLTQARVAIPPTPGLTDLVLDLVPPAGSLAQVLVRVQDPDGAPVRGAAVRFDDGEPVLTGEGGLALLAGLEPGPRTLVVQADRFQPVEPELLRLEAGPTERVVELRWVPRPVEVRVTGPDGAPISDAEVSFDGPESLAGTRTGPDGVARAALRPGSWRVLASAPTLGTQALAVVVRADDAARTVTLQLQRAMAEIEGDLVVIKDRIYFDTGRSELRSESAALLDEVAALLLAHPEIVRVEVGGHTDPIGGVPFNMELSRRRAIAVAQALIARGVAPERLVARGYGPTRPRADNETVEGRALNRRVEFRAETD